MLMIKLHFFFEKKNFNERTLYRKRYMCAEFPTFIKGVMVVLVKSLQGFFCKRQRKTCRACHNYPV